MKYTALSALVLSAAAVRAQQPLYAQCGGTGWTGSTTCVSGAVCSEQNAYYSQCLPSSAGAPVASSTAPPASSAKPPATSTGAPASSTGAPASSSAPVASGTAAPDTNNPFAGYQIYLSPYYASEVAAAAAQITNAATSQAAASVAQIPTFTWFDQVAKVPQLGTYLADALSIQQSTGQKQIVQIVVYDLPDRDCAAAASNGEFSIADNGQANYENYIDQIAAQVAAYPDVRVVAVIEPDSLANLVTNMSVQKCANAATTYKACVTYAMQKLSAVGVIMYLDAGHAGWLGWPANIQPAAQLFGQLLAGAQTGGQTVNVRGLATNVANYNALVAATPDPITQGNPNYDESLYINALAPLLTQNNFPAHFIVDQSRSGVQDIRQQWGDWCNVLGAGFGPQPSTNTGNSLIDSIVWVKPGGECDGTSNTSSPRYDYHCGQSDATQPAPEAGTWFQAFFVTLVEKANPALM